MWIVSGILSIGLCIAGWVLKYKKHPKATAASIASLILVVVTVLLQYSVFYAWIDSGNINALEGSSSHLMYSILSKYMVIMLPANLLAIFAGKK